MTSYRIVFYTLIPVLMGAIVVNDALASRVVHIPISAANRTDNSNRFNTIEMRWDQNEVPDPLLLRWGKSQVPVRASGLSPLAGAFDYALTRLAPGQQPTGTLSLFTMSSASISTEGPGAGAALAVGFLAVLKGDRLIDGIALTGALESTGRIGQVRNITEKIKAAAREGYRVLLIPRGQMYAPQVRLVGIGVEPNVVVREVGTIDEAYEIMTGKRL